MLEDPQTGFYSVECLYNGCAVKPETYGVTTEEDAAEQWNTRTAPEGMALVPVEPTKHMIEEAYYSRNCFISGSDDSGSIYKAMIKAAQEG